MSNWNYTKNANIQVWFGTAQGLDPSGRAPDYSGDAQILTPLTNTQLLGGPQRWLMRLVFPGGLNSFPSTPIVLSSLLPNAGDATYTLVQVLDDGYTATWVAWYVLQDISIHPGHSGAPGDDTGVDVTFWTLLSLDSDLS